MPIHKITETLNMGRTFKIAIPLNECPDIESFTGKYIRVTIGSMLTDVAELKNVKTWERKDQGEVLDRFKLLTLEIEANSCLEGVIHFPDKKSNILDDVEIEYGDE